MDNKKEFNAWIRRDCQIGSLINPEWEKLGPEADVHFLLNNRAFETMDTDNKMSMTRFNRALETADILTAYAADCASVAKLIWLLVNLGYRSEAVELQEGFEALEVQNNNTQTKGTK